LTIKNSRHIFGTTIANIWRFVVAIEGKEGISNG
jgi:hypothetical protein